MLLAPFQFLIARFCGLETQWVSLQFGPCAAGFILHLGMWGNRWFGGVAAVRQQNGWFSLEVAR